MGIVRFALRFPHTYYVVAALIIFLGVVASWKMPTDIFPEINIPVMTVIWQYTGLSTPEIDQRVSSEIQKRQPALAKAALSATVGAEQSPERAGGPSPGVREITDAEIDRMSLQEYEQYFDGNGHPRNGVRLRLTRGIDVSRR